MFQEKGLKPEDMPNLSNNFPRPSVVNQFTRKTLDNPYFNLSAIAEEDFVVEFLSYLRLHNRSEKRHINNGEKCKNTTWTVFESKEAVELDNQNEYSTLRNDIELSMSVFILYQSILQNRLLQLFLLLKKYKVFTLCFSALPNTNKF